jgi:predicted aspartyl protease
MEAVMLSDFSRRRLLAYGASALVFAPSFARADASHAQLITTPPDLIDGFTDMADRLMLETTIDGKGPYRFVVDTGADRSVVADDVAAYLGLLPHRDVVVQGIVRALPAPTVRLQNVSFGKITLDDVAAPVLPRKWLGADGFLGLDVIDGRKVIFDFQNRKLSVVHSGSSTGWPHFNEIVVRADGSNGRLKAVNCVVDDVEAVAFIDSGAQLSICNTPLFNELQKGGAKAIDGAEIPLIGATGGLMIGRLMEVSRIRLGDVLFTKTRLAISDLNVFDVWGLAKKPALFIGMDFLQQCSNFTIDYRHKELRFKLADFISRKDWQGGRLARL